MRRLHLTLVPALLLGLTVVFEVATVLLSWNLTSRIYPVVFAVSGVVMAGAGALVAARHPRNPRRNYKRDEAKRRQRPSGIDVTVLAKDDNRQPMQSRGHAAGVVDSRRR